MKRREQPEINLYISRQYYTAHHAFMDAIKNNGNIDSEPLYHCNAKVYKVGDYIILQSYYTVVAFIDIKKQLFVDVLRMVYEYTATSAQHIAKFRKKYSNYFNENNIYTWRDI